MENIKEEIHILKERLNILEDMYYRYNARKGEGVWRYIHYTLYITCTDKVVQKIEKQLKKEELYSHHRFIDNLQISKPMVESYSIEHIDNVLKKLLNNNKILLFLHKNGDLELYSNKEIKYPEPENVANIGGRILTGLSAINTLFGHES